MLERAIVELITSADFPDNVDEIETKLNRIFGQQTRESYVGTCIESYRKYVPEDPEALASYRRLVT